MKIWTLVRDVLITGLGLAVIASQMFAAHPDGLLLGTGLALTVPSVAEHVKALLPSSGGSSSSPSSPPGTQRPSPPSQQEESDGGE